MSSNQSHKAQLLFTFISREVFDSLNKPVILEDKKERQYSQQGSHWEFISQVDSSELGKDNAIWEEEQEVINKGKDINDDVKSNIEEHHHVPESPVVSS